MLILELSTEYPDIDISPEYLMKDKMDLKRVVLPEPLGPTIP